MTWQAYEVILRLRSPLHSGWRKVGNLHMTRPYVTGRMLWGALTLRLTRNALQGKGPATDSDKYRGFGEKVHRDLAFTYFYPALKSGDDYRVVWPWKDESTFRRRFLNSYQSTALYYPQQSAAEGSLHEVEFIAPHTLDTGEAVFLKGYIFETESCDLKWKCAVKRLQLGGERGYGWGAVKLVGEPKPIENKLFDGQITFENDKERPVIHLPENCRLLAHTLAENLAADGEVEPLVGREWRSNDPKNPYAGQYVDFSGVYYAPGSRVRAEQKITFQIMHHGLWETVSS